MIVQSTPTKILFSIGVASFLLIGLLGVYHIGMSIDASSHMSHCPFAPDDSLCAMTPVEHIGVVQSLFVPLSQEKNTASTLLFLLASLIILAPFFLRLTSPPELVLARDPTSSRDYIPTDGFLQEAYSRGILNPKLF